MLSRFYGLYDRNKDIGGWIKIDGTNVNYPVMKDTRNQFYRDHNYDRRYSPTACLTSTARPLWSTRSPSTGR